MYKYITTPEIRVLRRNLNCLIKYKNLLNEGSFFKRYNTGRMTYEDIISLCEIYKNLKITPNYKKILGNLKKLNLKNQEEINNIINLVNYGLLTEGFDELDKRNKDKIRRRITLFKSKYNQDYKKFINIEMNPYDICEYIKINMKNDNDVERMSLVLIEYLYKYGFINKKAKQITDKLYSGFSEGNNRENMDEICMCYSDLIRYAVKNKYEVYSEFMSALHPIDYPVEEDHVFRGIQSRTIAEMDYKFKEGDDEEDSFFNEIINFYGDDGYIICIKNFQLKEDFIKDINEMLYRSSEYIPTEVFNEDGNFYIVLSSNSLLDGIHMQGLYSLLVNLRRKTDEDDNRT